MTPANRILAAAAAAFTLLVSYTPTGSASPIVWGLNPVSGDIFRVDPSTGALLGEFAAPIKPVQGDARAGLSIADGGHTLLYQLGNNGPGLEVPGREILYGLDPYTGAVKFQVQGLGSSFGPDGISWESRGGSTFTFVNHANPIPDIHRFENLGGPGEEEILFWGPTQCPPCNHAVGGLGGDGNGREFGVFEDIDNLFGGHPFIGEYDPFVNVSDFVNTPFIAPADDIVGLAFDGRFLYASSASGPLYTVDPDTGVIVHSVLLPPLIFPDGSPAPYAFDIAAISEPATLALVGLAFAGLGFSRRREPH